MRFKMFLLVLLIPSAVSANDRVIVKRITDGDTIIVVLNGSNLKVRLIGIDTPERNENNKALKISNRTGKNIETIISQGKQATAYLKSILKKGDSVVLEYDIEKHDRYGRILAYVYLSDGRMLNNLIISSGYAYPLTIPPNIKHKDLFLKSYKTAREKKIGLWNEKYNK